MKNNKKAPYWLSTLSAFCTLLASFLLYTVFEPHWYGYIFLFGAYLFSFMTGMGIRDIIKYGANARPE